MKYKFVGKNIEVGDRLKDRLTKKVGKLEKFFHHETEATAKFSIVKNSHILELTIIENGILFRAEEKSDDMYVSIDKVVDVIERQIRKNRTRLSRRIRGGALKTGESFGYIGSAESFESFDGDDESYIVEEHEFNIVRNKKFQVRPMTLDEAILQMNLLSHAFFVFVDSESKEVNVVYKRNDGSYGLIEPEY